MVTKDIEAVYGHRTRVRVCGLLFRKETLLLVQHTGLGPKGELWSPPGGGLNYGETAIEALQREFKEETGLLIEVGKFLFVYEYLRPPLHALELFFHVKENEGILQKGIDPEFSVNKQTLKEVKFVTFQDIGIMEDVILHEMLTYCKEPKELLNQIGYFTF